MVLAGSCSKKEPEPGPPPADAARPLAATDAAPRPADAGAGAGTLEPLDIPAADQCESPCLLLASHRFASISEGAYCEVCKEIKPRACELEWPPIEDEPSCDDWDEWRTCLLAAHGYRFRQARTRALYRRKRWYRSRRKVTPERLGPVARANLEYLETRSKACREALAAQAGRTIARLRGDFNGDGRKRTAIVTDSQVKIGRESIDHGVAPSDTMSAIEATLIDIDSGDRAVEILVAMHPGESAASRYVVVYVQGEARGRKGRKRRKRRKGPLVASDVIETFGTVEANGAGALEVREEVCGQTREMAFEYKDGALVKTRDAREGEREADCE